jgi:hypothetical protein
MPIKRRAKWPIHPRPIIRHYKRLPRGTLVVILTRVSHDSQLGNLEPQVQALLRLAKKHGWIVIKIIRRVRVGKIRDEFEFLSTTDLQEAVKLAKRHGAAILMESKSRLIRHREYDPENYPNLMPTEVDYFHLGRLLDGAPVYLAAAPSSSPAQIRSHETRRGMYERNRLGGRPRMHPPGWQRERKAKCMPLIIKYYRRMETVCLQRKIENQLAYTLDRQTILNWLKKWRAESLRGR